MTDKRLNHEPPAVTTLGWRYHHIGIPHTQPRPEEHHVAHLGVHVSGFETSPYGIEWIRFEPHCRVPEIVRTVPHIAFAVDDLDEALEGREILIAVVDSIPGTSASGKLWIGTLLTAASVSVGAPAGNKNHTADKEKTTAEANASAKPNGQMLLDRFSAKDTARIGVQGSIISW